MSWFPVKKKKINKKNTFQSQADTMLLNSLAVSLFFVFVFLMQSRTVSKPGGNKLSHGLF